MGPRSSSCTLVLLAVAAALQTTAVVAQDGAEPIVIGERTDIHSETLGEDRSVWIYTPRGYGQTSTQYPVLYLLDGDAHFHHASGVAQFLAANDRAPEMIVVGIPNTDRTRDLTPPTSVDSVARRQPTAGGADAFLQFLTEELQPWVERTYRTAPYRILVGHSFGGLFATHTLLTRPEAFDAYVSISPSLWWDNERVVRQATAAFAAHQDMKGSLYMTMGNEGGMMLAGAWGFTRALETNAPDSLTWTWKHMPAEDHGSVPHRSLYDGLEWVFDDWHLPGVSQLLIAGGDDGLRRVDDHFAGLSERYGYTVTAPQRSLQQIGRYLLRQEQFDNALRVLQYASITYPESASVYHDIGETYEARCELSSAVEAYTKAYHMTDDSNQEYLESLRGAQGKTEDSQGCGA